MGGLGLMDDSTWCCDYHSRCDNKIIKLFLQDLQDARNMDEVNDVINKWDERYKKNEEDDK